MSYRSVFATKNSVQGDTVIFKTLHPLVLASASPRRNAFLRDIGLEAGVVAPPGPAEPSPLPGEAPDLYALRAAEAKAFGALPHITGDAAPLPRLAPVVIAADTIVVLGEDILGKPRSPAHAYAMLSSLKGKTHAVITGCVILAVRPAHRSVSPSAARRANYSADPRAGASAEILRAFTVQSLVRMWDAPPDLVHAYAMSGEPLDKAGAYAVQGAGAFLVQAIEGSWSNVVGLPLAELVRALLDLGLIAPAGGGTPCR